MKSGFLQVSTGLLIALCFISQVAFSVESNHDLLCSCTVKMLDGQAIEIKLPKEIEDYSHDSDFDWDHKVQGEDNDLGVKCDFIAKSRNESASSEDGDGQLLWVAFSVNNGPSYNSTLKGQNKGTFEMSVPFDTPKGKATGISGHCEIKNADG
ncbi:MAG: hypothetical protein AB7T49_19190 [Oligoflexales bacterium]